MHARYLLTNVGGYSVDSGLDEAQGVSQDVRLMDRRAHVQRWKEFDSGSRVFERVGAFSITGVRNETVVGS